MKYAYYIAPNGKIIFTKGECIIFYKELTKEDYNNYIEARREGRKVVVDKNGELLIELLDNTEVEYRERQLLLMQAQQAFLNANLGRYEYDKLTLEQREELNLYLDKLNYIIKNNANGADILPTKPEFL